MRAASIRWPGFFSGGSSQYLSVGVMTVIGDVDGGGVTDGGSLGGCQRSHWEIYCACHSNGSWRCTRRECKTVQSCSGGILSCGNVISAQCC